MLKFTLKIYHYTNELEVLEYVRVHENTLMNIHANF